MLDSISVLIVTHMIVTETVSCLFPVDKWPVWEMILILMMKHKMPLLSFIIEISFHLFAFEWQSWLKLNRKRDFDLWKSQFDSNVISLYELIVDCLHRIKVVLPEWFFIMLQSLFYLLEMKFGTIDLPEQFFETHYCVKLTWFWYNHCSFKYYHYQGCWVFFLEMSQCKIILFSWI